MKRYARFFGDRYYPLGGWEDLDGTYDTIEEATVVLEPLQWYHIVDLETGVVVKEEVK